MRNTTIQSNPYLVLPHVLFLSGTIHPSWTSLFCTDQTCNDGGSNYGTRTWNKEAYVMTLRVSSDVRKDVSKGGPVDCLDRGEP